MTGITMLGRATAESQQLRARMEVLTRQVSDGRKGELYGDIAPEARRAIDLRAEVARRDAYAGTLDRALARTGVAQKTLSRLSDIAEQFFAETFQLNGVQPGRVGTAARNAAAAMQEVAALLNEQYDGEYLFSGTDSANPPVPDPANIATAGFAADIAAAVGGLGGGNAAAVAAATLAAASSDAAGTTPFSAFLSDPATGGTEPRRSVPSGDGDVVGYGLFANRNADAVSAGETTGSWARDLLRGLATLAAMTDAQTTLGADFTDLVGTIREGLRSAVDGLAQEAGALGATEQRMEATRIRHEEVTVTLSAQLSTVEEVDMAETISRLQQTQTQLQASYRAISMAGSLSLAQFL
jgi:flagellin-like hook-associated protein FlgL